MSALAVIALVTGVLGVWLTIKHNILCWPAAIVSTVSSAVEFYNERLFGDMSLQVFYFFAGIYGWVFWKKKQRTAFSVERMPSRFVPWMAASAIALSGAAYVLLLRLDGDQPLFDAVLTGSSLAATYMMTRKWVENWALWVVIDGAYVVLYLIKEMWAFAALYLFFAVIASYGFNGWKRQLRASAS